MPDDPPRLVALSERLYRLLLIAYPPQFRQSYGAELRQVFRTCCRVAYQRGGTSSLLGIWGSVIIDLIASAPREHIAALQSAGVVVDERSMEMANEVTGNEHAFGERLAQVLGQDSSYYQLLVIAEPTRRMWDIVESLALDGDPDQPQATLQMFQDLSDDIPEGLAERWLAGLRDAAQRLGHTLPAEVTPGFAGTLLRHITADPALYELIASAEPGYGLLELIENLALEGNVDDIEAMLRLMRQLAVK